MPYLIDLRNTTPAAAGAALAELVASKATCPTCGTSCGVYHDKSGAAFLARHANRRGAWCKMSGKKITK